MEPCETPLAVQVISTVCYFTIIGSGSAIVIVSVSVQDLESVNVIV